MIELFREVEQKMKQGVDHLHEELKHLRTGRASIAILDGVTAEVYGSPMPLNQLANMSVPDPTLIVAQPFDPSTIGAIEKAIQGSDLGLNPSNDGKVIRIPVPQLTEERRKDMVRRAHDLGEATRNVIRQARREGNDRLKAMEKDKEIGQDDEHRGLDEIQKLHDHYIGETNTTLEHKEKDILTV